MGSGLDATTREALERELALARAERDQAQAREAALAEVLQAINGSSGNLAPIFDMIIGKAMALCDAAFGALLAYENDQLSLLAHRNGSPALVGYWSTPQFVDPSSTISRALREGKTSQIVDLAESENYRKRLPMTVVSVEQGHIRTLVQVPLHGERGPIGLFILYRQEVRPFTNQQIALVEAFAAQAVLAMENARLFTEQREALEQQTATAEVLEVINSSPGELAPVFDAMLERAMRLCEAAFGIFGRFDGNLFESITDRGLPKELREAVRTVRSPPPSSGLGQIAAGAAVAQLTDLANSEAYRSGFLGATALVDIGGAQTAIFVALRKDEVLLGAIVMYRRENRAFTDKQIALLQNFGAQAVIAIENARLLTEQREALEQQTATADILRVISQSPTDIEPVMLAVAKAAVRFCGAEDAHVFLRDGDEMVSSAHEGPLSAHRLGYRDALDAANTARADTILEARVTHLPDTLAPDAEAAYRSIRENSIQHGFRAQLNAPMLKDGQAIGCICLRRRDPGAFTPRQITLLETFAAQAVIAIENVRLFSELKETLEQQTATAEILRAISESPTDVRPVLDVVVKAAQRFCGAEDVVVSLREGDELAIAAHDGPISAPPPRRLLDRSSTQGRAVIDATTIHLPDIKQLNPAEWSAAIGFSRPAGAQAAVAAPMLREGTAVGAIMLRRREPGPFSPRQIELLEIFAAQAVIAIENVRLFTELRDSLDQQTASADVLRVISQSPTSVQPVFDVIAESALRLLGGWSVIVWRHDGSRLHIGAAKGGHPGSAEALPAMLEGLAPDDIFVGDAVRHGAVQRIVDVESEDVAPQLRDLARARGWRSNLAVPMMREGQPVGVFTLARAEPGAFSDRDVQLLQSFAAQAVIAIENVRLFTELREALEQQTATSEILGVISQSPTDVDPVLTAVAKAMLRFCGGTDAIIGLRDGDHWLIAGHEGILPASIGMRVPLDRQTSPGAAILDARTAHFPDIATLDPVEFAASHDFSRRQGFRAAVAAPMLREGVAIGAVVLRRAEPGAFTPRQIELLEGFAAQAVIAIENTRLFTELRESLDYQTATSDVLSVISRSTSELEPVLKSMLAAATRLCGVHMGGVAVRRGDVLRYLTSTGVSAEFDKWLRETPHPIDRTSIAGRAAADKRVTYIPNLAADADYAMPHTTTVGNMQSLLAVPLVREDEVVGVMTLGRSNTERFTERQIGLLRTFADQAVIAMENTRLLADLRESLDYQTATSEVLEVISRSTSDLAPVLNKMLAAAAHLCGVEKGDVSIRRDGQMRYAASIGTSPAEDTWLRTRIIAADRSTCAGRAMVTRQVVHVLDQSADPELAVPSTISAHQTVLSVPLLREGEAIGVITVLRDHVEPFTDRQIALIKTFADQAVIAIENARLLGELRERTDDLTESLEYQTATSDLLEVISRSTADIQPVLDRMLSSAARLCGVAKGDVAIRQGDVFRHVAFIGAATPEEDAWLRSRVTVPGRGTSTARALLEKQVDHVVDQSRDPERVAPAAATAARTTLAVPLLREGEAIGVISLLRDHVEPFSERQIALVKTFADQAVIAMENARLLGELTRREEELRVTFDHMGDGVVMFDAGLRLASWNRNFQELLDIPDSFLAGHPTLEDYVRLLAGRGELSEDGAENQIAQYRERAEQQWSVERTRPDGRILEVRNNPVPGGGAVLIYSDITERKRSESAIRSARDAAEAALLQLKAAQANLVQSEKMASLGQLTAGIAHEIKNPLNFVNNFATLSVELLDEVKEIAGPALETLDADKRADLDEAMGLLTGNLGKIAEHGKRADGIVKSMLSHSRGGSGDWQASDINGLVEEALNLAYHGARAQDKEFNVTLERDFEPAGKPIEVVPQDVMRVFLNLFGNGFYATNKRRLAKEAGFRPALKVSTRDLGDAVEVKVRDNGIGIPAEVRAKLFQPFFTTKPTGEGTGLGLSISYDIVTQQHGGAIGVESEVGNFTEFTVRLPRIPRVASTKKV